MDMSNDDDPVWRTVAAYDRQAEQYIERTGELSYYPGLAEELDEFTGMLGVGPIADLGTGSGRDAFYLAGGGRHVIAVDLSARLIESLAKRSVETAVFPVRADICFLPFADQSMSGILCSGTLLHVPRAKVQLVLRHMIAALRRGGVCLLSMKQGEGAGWYENHGLGQRWMEYYSLDELRALCTAAGFIVERTYGPRRKNWITVAVRRP